MAAQVEDRVGDRTDDVERRRIGKYQVVKEHGRGGMARVYLAMAMGPSGFRKPVILKQLRDDYVADDVLRGLFLEEARLASRLSHPNIVHTYEIIFDGRCPLLVMEFLEGASLDQLHPSLSRDEALGILGKVLEGLEYAHELCDFDGTPLRLVHRDVKRSNIFVTFNGEVKLLDFGVAKAANRMTGSTATGELRGTVPFMAPEAFGEGKVDRRSDLYSVGVLLWEAAAQKRMWEPRAKHAAVMFRVASGDLPNLDDDVPPALRKIVDKALALDPNDRYQTAKALRLDLEAFLAAQDAPFSARALSRRMQELLGDTREDVRRQLQAAIDDEPVKSSVPESTELPTRTVPGLVLSSSRSEERRPRRRPSAGLLLGAAATLVTVIAIASSQGESGAQPDAVAAEAEPEPEPEPEATPEPAPTEVAPDTVTVQIAASPDGATIYLDGTALASNPAEIRRPPDAEEHTARIEAEGYETLEVPVHIDADAKLHFALSRAPEDRARPSRHPPRDARRPRPKQEAPAQPKAEPRQDPKEKRRLTLDKDNPYRGASGG